MREFRVIKKLYTSEKVLWGYRLQDKYNPNEFFDVTEKSIIKSIRAGIVKIEDVIITKSNKLRGSKGHQISKLDSEVRLTGNDIMGFKNILKYLMMQMSDEDIFKNSIFTSEFKNNKLVLNIKTYLEDYSTMPTKVANKELNQAFDFYTLFLGSYVDSVEAKVIPKEEEIEGNKYNIVINAVRTYG